MAPLSSDYLFVYSSLREGFKNPEYEYISRYFSFAGTAKARGTLSDLGNFPAATPTLEDHFIVGELYRINNRDEFSFAIGQLDDYEGVKPEPGGKPLFERQMAPVFTDGGKEVSAWIYWYRGDVAGKPIIDSGDVLEYLSKK